MEIPRPHRAVGHLCRRQRGGADHRRGRRGGGGHRLHRGVLRREERGTGQATAIRPLCRSAAATRGTGSSAVQPDHQVGRREDHQPRRIERVGKRTQGRDRDNVNHLPWTQTARECRRATCSSATRRCRNTKIRSCSTAAHPTGSGPPRFPTSVPSRARRSDNATALSVVRWTAESAVKSSRAGAGRGTVEP